MFTSWRTSSYSSSGSSNQCVEVGMASGRIGVRDTKDRDRGHVAVPRAAFAAFVAGVKRAR